MQALTVMFLKNKRSRKCLRPSPGPVALWDTWSTQQASTGEEVCVAEYTGVEVC